MPKQSTKPSPKERYDPTSLGYEQARAVARAAKARAPVKVDFDPLASTGARETISRDKKPKMKTKHDGELGVACDYLSCVLLWLMRSRGCGLVACVAVPPTRTQPRPVSIRPSSHRRSSSAADKVIKAVKSAPSTAPKVKAMPEPVAVVKPEASSRCTNLWRVVLPPCQLRADMLITVSEGTMLQTSAPATTPPLRSLVSRLPLSGPDRVALLLTSLRTPPTPTGALLPLCAEAQTPRLGRPLSNPHYYPRTTPSVLTAPEVTSQPTMDFYARVHAWRYDVAWKAAN